MDGTAVHCSYSILLPSSGTLDVALTPIGLKSLASQQFVSGEPYERAYRHEFPLLVLSMKGEMRRRKMRRTLMSAKRTSTLLGKAFLHKGKNY